MVLIFDIKSIGVQQVGVGEKGVSLIIIIVFFFLVVVCIKELRLES